MTILRWEKTTIFWLVGDVTLTLERPLCESTTTFFRLCPHVAVPHCLLSPAEHRSAIPAVPIPSTHSNPALLSTSLEPHQTMCLDAVRLPLGLAPFTRIPPRQPNRFGRKANDSLPTLPETTSSISLFARNPKLKWPNTSRPLPYSRSNPCATS